jgi:hypothetical protein
VEFCRSTSLHGLQYIGEKQRHVLERWVGRVYKLFNNCCKVSMFVNFGVRNFLSSWPPNIVLLLLSFMSGSKYAFWNHVANDSVCHVLQVMIRSLSAQSKCLSSGEVYSLCAMWNKNCSIIIWLIKCVKVFVIY